MDRTAQILFANTDVTHLKELEPGFLLFFFHWESSVSVPNLIFTRGGNHAVFFPRFLLFQQIYYLPG